MCWIRKKKKEGGGAFERAGSRQTRTLDVRLDVDQSRKVKKTKKKQKEERGRDGRRRGDEACRTMKRR